MAPEVAKPQNRRSENGQGLLSFDAPTPGLETLSPVKSTDLHPKSQFLLDTILGEIRGQPILRESPFVALIARVIGEREIPDCLVYPAYHRATLVTAAEAFASDTKGDRAFSALRTLCNFPGSRVTLSEKFSIPPIKKDVWYFALADALDLTPIDRPLKLFSPWMVEVEGAWKTIFDSVCTYRRLYTDEPSRSVTVVGDIRAAVARKIAERDAFGEAESRWTKEFTALFERRSPLRMEWVNSRLNALASEAVMREQIGELGGSNERAALHAARAYFGLMAKTNLAVPADAHRAEYIGTAFAIVERYVARAHARGIVSPAS